MKPDTFMPFHGLKFAAAVAGLPRAVKGSYVMALIHYWHHTHCAGLKDNDDFLRRLCECEKDEWEETKEILFDNDQFFTLGADGLWHQKFADEKWNEVKTNYDIAVQRGKSGAKERWKEHKRK